MENEEYVVLVQDMEGNPLMPTKRFGKVRRMLKAGQAKAVRTKPFTIRLLYEPKTKITQPMAPGMGAGSANVESAAAKSGNAS